MPDPIITNNDSSVLVLGDDFYRNSLMTVVATTYLRGTILARDTTTGKLIPYVKGGVVDGNGIPITVLANEIVNTVVGDITIRPFTTARVRRDKLIIFADGDDSNIDDIIVDELRDYGIFSEDVTELNIPDNQ